MSEQKPITNADLARHWECSPPYITKLVKTRQMPAFLSLADADAWRAVNAPPRKSAKASANNGIEDGKKIAFIADTTTPQGNKEGTATGCSAPNRGETSASNVIDVRSYIRPGADFDALMIEDAEGVPQVAHGLYLRACERGNPNEIAAQLKNWNDAAHTAADVRERYLEIQEKARTLLSLDEMMDVIGTELQAWRSAMLKLGERTATVANPENPQLAQRAIDAAVDEAFHKLEAGIEHARAELGPKAAAS